MNAAGVRFLVLVKCRLLLFKGIAFTVLRLGPSGGPFLVPPRKGGKNAAQRRAALRRELAAVSASLEPHSCGASWRDKKLPAGGTQPTGGQGHAPKTQKLTLPQAKKYKLRGAASTHATPPKQIFSYSFALTASIMATHSLAISLSPSWRPSRGSRTLPTSGPPVRRRISLIMAYILPLPEHIL